MRRSLTFAGRVPAFDATHARASALPGPPDTSGAGHDEGDYNEAGHEGAAHEGAAHEGAGHEEAGSDDAGPEAPDEHGELTREARVG